MPDAVLFHDDQLGGSHVHIHQATPNLTTVGFNNDTSSIAIKSGQWEFFGGENYGNSGHTPHPVVLGPGIYYTADMASMGIGNDDLSSMKPI